MPRDTTNATECKRSADVAMDICCGLPDTRSMRVSSDDSMAFPNSSANAVLDMNNASFCHLAECGTNASRIALGNPLDRPWISIDSGMAPDRCNQISISGMADARVPLGTQIEDHSFGVLKDVARQLLQIWPSNSGGLRISTRGYPGVQASSMLTANICAHISGGTRCNAGVGGGTINALCASRDSRMSFRSCRSR